MLGRGSGLTAGTVVSVGASTSAAASPVGRENIVITNKSQPGDLGAPVFTDDGAIVGMLWGSDGRQSFVVPIRPVLSELGVELTK
jgi:hypothetical protein